MVSAGADAKVRLLFVYKHNSQDPTQKSLINTFPKYVKEFQTFCFQPDERKRFSPDNLNISERFQETVRKVKPTHIFMWLVYLNADEIQWCKDQNIFVVAAINGFASFSTGLFKNRDLHIKSLQLLDVFFIPHEPHIARMKYLGINAIELPFSYDPKIFKPLKFIRSLHFQPNKFFFVGNFGDNSIHSQYRIEMLTQVANSGDLLTVSDKKITHKNIRHFMPIPYERVLNLLANLSKYLVCTDYFPNLNEYNDLNQGDVSDYDVNDKYAIRPRIYTMMGTGLPVIIERHEQLNRFFEDEKHLIMWSGYEELNDKIAYYDRNETKYRAIAQNACKFIQEFHTIDNRIKEIIMPHLIN
jgi:spore maturation protein CgeB